MPVESNYSKLRIASFVSMVPVASCRLAGFLLPFDAKNVMYFAPRPFLGKGFAHPNFAVNDDGSSNRSDLSSEWNGKGYPLGLADEE